MAKPGTSEKPIRVLIVDDHKIIREGLCDLIASQPGMMVVGDASNRADALGIVLREQPDVVVLDLDLGAESGLELIPELLQVLSELIIIVLTGVRNADERDKAMELGAKGALLAWPIASLLVHLALTALFGPRDPDPYAMGDYPPQLPPKA